MNQSNNYEIAMNNGNFCKLYHGDCLEIMRTLPDNSFDMVLCDLPYGSTRNSWDEQICMQSLWENYVRIVKDNGAIVLFGQGLFSAKLIVSNETMYKYSLIWKKGERATGFLNAKRMPLRNHEDILVFYKKQPTYNPQFTVGKPNHGRGQKIYSKETTSNYGRHSQVEGDKSELKYPKSILNFEKPVQTLHPTQKPVDLLMWLIKTYTNEGEVVLDNCMGSGSTGVASVLTNRSFIGIEKDEQYFSIAKSQLDSIKEGVLNER